MNKLRVLLVLVALLATTTSFAQFVRKSAISKSANGLSSSNSESSTKNRIGPSFRQLAKKCSGDMVSQRVFEEYGAVFGANSAKVFLPGKCFFKNEAEVQQFQRQANFSSETIDGIKVQLQSEALKAFLAARAEARKSGLELTPRGADSSRRNYNDTLKLWLGRMNESLDYWVKKDKIIRQEAVKIRSLQTDKQVFEILKLEERGIYFGKGFAKSILQSVAVPGSSQHNLMLALDIEQHANSKAREILAKYGWFQTVKNDTPHFTFLGFKESELASIGLKRTSAGGRTIWVFSLPSRSTSSSVEKTENEKKTASDGATRPRTVGKNDDNKEKSKVKRTSIELPSERVPATASKDVILPVSIEPLLSLLTQRYYLRTKKRLHITSGYRSPERQAKAMYFNLVNYGNAYVAGTYGGRAEVWQVIRAFQENREDEERAVRAMTEVLRTQIKRGKIISRHMLEKAFDIRSRGAEAANLFVLMAIVGNMGGEVVVEKDHYHVEFR